MRICYVTATNKLIESQSGGEGQESLDVMFSNAVNSGYNIKDITAKFVSEEEFKAFLSLPINLPPQPPVQPETNMTIKSLTVILVKKKVLLIGDLPEPFATTINEEIEKEKNK
jgi:hypothetical protein